MRGTRRCAAAAVLGLGALVVGTAPAAAVMTRNNVGCEGSATITDGGRRYTGNSESAEVDVPREGSIAWQGSVSSPPSGAYAGEINLIVGGQAIRIDDWGGERTTKDGDSGTRTMPELAKQIPAGKYRVEGQHSQDGAGCAGYVIVSFSGSILSTPAGAASVVGAVLALLGLLYSMRVKVPGGVR